MVSCFDGGRPAVELTTEQAVTHASNRRSHEPEPPCPLGRQGNQRPRDRQGRQAPCPRRESHDPQCQATRSGLSVATKQRSSVPQAMSPRPDEVPHPALSRFGATPLTSVRAVQLHLTWYGFRRQATVTPTVRRSPRVDHFEVMAPAATEGLADSTGQDSVATGLRASDTSPK